MISERYIMTKIVVSHNLNMIKDLRKVMNHMNDAITYNDCITIVNELVEEILNLVEDTIERGKCSNKELLELNTMRLNIKKVFNK